jgi:multidrug efflux pump subunit AcrA (membrane-fusion protein)
MTTRKRTPIWLATLAFGTCLGCGGDDNSKLREKAPRPVTVFALETMAPKQTDRLTASVGSWKTEDLGFEVGGRANFVIEPEVDIEGEVFVPDKDGSIDLKNRVQITAGTVLAKLDETRYRLAVESVDAQIKMAIEQKRVATIEVDEVILAQREAADADLVFRKSEVDRTRPLVGTGAIPESDFDRLVANWAAAKATLKQVDAQKAAKHAEVASLQAKVDELQESLAQANRDVADCQLRSPFRGQIAFVHVIPGAVVKTGEPVVTVQMMDPIKVEVEVSAETSRRLKYRDVVQVTLPSGVDGTTSTDSDSADDEPPSERGIVYSVDPVADPVTRTFSVTLLMRNRKVQSQPPENFGEEVVRVRDVWRLNDAPYALKKGVHFVDEHAIHQDGDQYYVWKVSNYLDVVERKSPVLNVERLNVIPGDLRMDWLGLWTFREVSLVDGQDFDYEKDFVAGKLSQDEPLLGGKLLWDRQWWRLRPGDLVEVDLSAVKAAAGFYVPMDAIRISNGKASVFSVVDGQANQIEVIVSDGPGTLNRIAPVKDGAITDGSQIVAAGAHYIRDGEAVNVVEEKQVQQ